MTDTSSRSVSTPDEGVVFGFYCNTHDPSIPHCPFQLAHYTGRPYVLDGFEVYCHICPVFQAIVERNGIAVQ